MPESLADFSIDLVLAVRQPLSAPTWAKPRVIFLSDLSPPAPAPAPPLLLPQAVSKLSASIPDVTATTDLLYTAFSFERDSVHITRSVIDNKSVVKTERSHFRNVTGSNV